MDFDEIVETGPAAVLAGPCRIASEFVTADGDRIEMLIGLDIQLTRPL